MKVDRVIIPLNNNPVFTGFWNPFSRVWKEKHNIIPTLFFVGTEEELESNNFSRKHGEIFRLDPVKEVVVDPNLDWSTTWALFYGASQFDDEVCVTMGIDQITLTHKLFDFLKKSDKITNDKYVVGMSDGYKQYGMSHYPSAWHIAKGSLFKEVLKIDSDWDKELKKVFSFREKYPTLPDNFWALDEVYSSDMIMEYIKKNGDDNIALLNITKEWYSRRLCRNGLLIYDKKMLQTGEYSELHSPRPFEDNSDYLLSLIDDLLQ